MRESSFRLPANETTAVRITGFAPTSTKPGVYGGEAVFRAGKQKVATLPFKIRVAKATVPKQTLMVTNWFTLGEQNVARYYDLDGSQDRYWEVLGNIARVIGHTGRT